MLGTIAQSGIIMKTKQTPSAEKECVTWLKASAKVERNGSRVKRIDIDFGKYVSAKR